MLKPSKRKASQIIGCCMKPLFKKQHPNKIQGGTPWVTEILNNVIVWMVPYFAQKPGAGHLRRPTLLSLFKHFTGVDHKTLKNETLASGAISSSSSSSSSLSSSSSSSSACWSFWRVHENVQQRSMTYVCKCMRTYSSVAWRMCASAWERTAA